MSRRAAGLTLALMMALGQSARAQVPGAYPGPPNQPAGVIGGDSWQGAEPPAPAQPIWPTPDYGSGWPADQPGPATSGAMVYGGQETTVLVSLPPDPLRLTDGPGTLDILVEGAPAFRGFELILEFDPVAMVLTQVSPGAIMSAAGGTLRPLGPDLSTPGRLVYGLNLADATTWPSGSGALARVTLAPLAQSGTLALRLVSATLIDETGQRIAALTRDGWVEIPVSPPAAAQTEAVASATALAEATPVAETVPGLDLEALSDRLAASGGWLLWLAVLGFGGLIALTGWALGRDRGAGGPGQAA